MSTHAKASSETGRVHSNSPVKLITYIKYFMFLLFLGGILHFLKLDLAFWVFKYPIFMLFGVAQNRPSKMSTYT